MGGRLWDELEVAGLEFDELGQLTRKVDHDG